VHLGEDVLAERLLAAGVSESSRAHHPPRWKAHMT
jgi:hypothetical protein